MAYDFDALSDRDRAEIQLALIDADLARWYVHDGQLSEDPLERRLSPHGARLRAKRLDAIAEFERLGGRDPHPLFMVEPTPIQRAAYAARRQQS